MRPMVPNAGFWARYFRRVHVPAIRGFCTGALDMVAPAFGRIAEEANAAVEGERERLGSSSGVWGTGEYDADPSIEYYETMSAVRQSILNLLAVGLHHLFEQQQLFFLRKELVRGDGGKLKAEAIERHLTECGVNYQRLTSTARLDELRLAANAIKHGDGRSARELAPLRPDLFEYSVPSREPTTENALASEGPAAIVPSIFAPLTGHDLYVSEQHLSEWCDAATTYWNELAAILDSQAQPAR